MSLIAPSGVGCRTDATTHAATSGSWATSFLLIQRNTLIAQVRSRLGYDERQLVLCSVGGTTLGDPLLRLFAAAYPRIKERAPDARMMLVAGPSIDPDALEVAPDVEVHGYIPRLYEHLAACDVAVVQAGGTTTLELTALRRPFVHFPLEGHFEQSLVAEQLSQHQAGEQLAYSQTTPDALADAVLRLLGCTRDGGHAPRWATCLARRKAGDRHRRLAVAGRDATGTARRARGLRPSRGRRPRPRCRGERLGRFARA